MILTISELAQRGAVPYVLQDRYSLSEASNATPFWKGMAGGL
jgi:hypothetical protein